MNEGTSDFLKAHRASHSPFAIRRRFEAGPTDSYLRDFVYGAIDGTVTTFAIVSGVAGADLSVDIVLVLGMANLIGDGFSMGASNFLGTRAEQQLRERTRRTEEAHIEIYPEGEREEIRQLFIRKGFTGADLDNAVATITADRERWIETMLREEFGLAQNSSSPWRAAIATFIAFVLVGVLPLLPFLTEWLLPNLIREPYLWSTIITGFAFFAVGAAKSRFVMEKWYWSGTETLLIGGSAAALAYLIGVMMKGVAIA